MEKSKPKGVPPVTPKSQMREEVSKYSRANTGGDPYDRMRGNYSKKSTVKDNDADDMYL